MKARLVWKVELLRFLWLFFKVWRAEFHGRGLFRFDQTADMVCMNIKPYCLANKPTKGHIQRFSLLYSFVRDYLRKTLISHEVKTCIVPVPSLLPSFLIQSLWRFYLYHQPLQYVNSLWVHEADKHRSLWWAESTHGHIVCVFVWW